MAQLNLKNIPARIFDYSLGKRELTLDLYPEEMKNQARLAAWSSIDTVFPDAGSVFGFVADDESGFGVQKITSHSRLDEMELAVKIDDGAAFIDQKVRVVGKPVLTLTPKGKKTKHADAVVRIKFIVETNAKEVAILKTKVAHKAKLPSVLVSITCRQMDLESEASKVAQRKQKAKANGAAQVSA